MDDLDVVCSQNHTLHSQCLSDMGLQAWRRESIGGGCWLLDATGSRLRGELPSLLLPHDAS